jgi:hypothetical protein
MVLLNQTGQASYVISPGREQCQPYSIVGKEIRHFNDRWLIIEDNLSIHTSRQVKLALACLAGDPGAVIPSKLAGSPDRTLVEAIAFLALKVVL